MTRVARAAILLAVITALPVIAMEIRAGLVPQEAAMITLSDGVVLRVERWRASLLGNDRYDLVVTAHGGEIRAPLVENWGPANRTNLYREPNGDLVALAAGGWFAVFVTFDNTGKPSLIPQQKHPRDGSEAWTYLGATDWSRSDDRLRFYSAVEQPECFPMLGAGESPYRMEHQVPHSCSRGS